MRRGGLSVLVAAAVVALVVGVGAVVVDRTGGRAASEEPGTETVVVDAPRGRILDRSGKVLVEDGTALQVRADGDLVATLGADGRDDLLAALAEVLVLDRAQRWPPTPGIATGAPISIASLGERLDADTDPVVLATGVGDAVRDAVAADPERFPGVTVEPIGARTYRYGALAAHVLGYSGRITEAQLEERADEDLPEDAVVGQTGVEAARDADLRGRPGRVVYQLDEDGQRVRELVDRRVEPEPGRDVYLTIDVNLQYLVERGLAAEVARRTGVQDNGCFLPGGCDPQGAAAVAVDPRNGQVLALASYPTYDPALFAGGISTADYEAIADEERADEHHHPLLDRATSGLYAPGSTWKPFVAHAGLAAGLLTPTERFNDTGVYRYSADCPTTEENNSCSAQNAGAQPHGSVDLADALRVSSDTYFYALGDEAWRARDAVGEEALQDGLEEWGFGQPTGIDLVGDTAGRVPTPAWLREFSEQVNADDPELAAEAGTWTSGVSGNLAVGQGDARATPLQLAQGYAALAAGGTRWTPQVVLQTTPFGTGAGVEVVEPDEAGQVELPPEWGDPLVAGLDGVTKGPGGTATSLFTGFDQSACPVMAKTGTGRQDGRNDTSVFAAVAPTPTTDRESVVALAAVVEEAGFGVAAAGPVARRVLQPFAAMGCDITAFGSPDSPYEAPLGGRIDVAEAVADFVPPAATTPD